MSSILVKFFLVLSITAAASYMLYNVITWIKKRTPSLVNKTAHEDLAFMVADIQANLDEIAFKWLRTAGWALAPFALPAGAVAVLAGEAARAIKAKQSLKLAKMSETWFAKILDEATPEGKVALGKLLAKKGH